MHMTLQPALQPKVNLTPSVIPLSLVRLTIVGDLLRNFGAAESEISTAQQGFSEGVIVTVQVEGTTAQGYLADLVALSFDELVKEIDVAISTTGKPVIEALSLKLAKALEYSVQSMRRQGLSVRFVYRFHPRVAENPAALAHAFQRFGMVSTTLADCAPGTRLETLLTLRPELDGGTCYSHAKARKLS